MKFAWMDLVLLVALIAILVICYYIERHVTAYLENKSIMRSAELYEAIYLQKLHVKETREINPAWLVTHLRREGKMFRTLTEADFTPEQLKMAKQCQWDYWTPYDPKVTWTQEQWHEHLYKEERFRRSVRRPIKREVQRRSKPFDNLKGRFRELKTKYNQA